MEVDLEEELTNHKFGGFIDYADLGDNRSVKYAKIIDFNGQRISVPYNDPEKVIKYLIQSYLNVTDCKKTFKGKQKELAIKNIKSKTVYFMHKTIKQIQKECQAGQIAITCGQEPQEDELCVLAHNVDYYDPLNYMKDPNGKKITITVKALQNTFNIQLFDTDPIGRMKQIIAQKMSHFSGTKIGWHQIRILHVGNAVKNGERIKQSDLNYKQPISVFEQKIVKEIQEIFYLNIKMIGSKNWKLQVKTTEKIEQIAKFVQLDKKIKIDQFSIQYSGKKLDLSKRISDYGIKSGHTLNIIPKNIDKNKKIDKSDVIIVFKISNNQTMELFYSDIKDLTVRSFFDYYVDASKPFWCMYYKRPYLPHEKISALESQLQSAMTIQILKNEKYFFFSKLKNNPEFPKDQFKLDQKQSINIVKTSETIKQRVIKNISDKKFRKEDHTEFIKEQFYSPIQYYTCPKFYKQINLFLRELNVNSATQYTQKKQFKFINALIQNIKKIPNFIGQVHRGMQKFKFSNYHEVGDIICWKSFTSSSADQNQAKKFIKKEGCLIHINSLQGKPVDAFSVYQYEKQVIFLPFTYFYIDRIQTKEEIEQIWITQVPSPVTFTKDVIMWVDDIPTNNLNTIAKLDKYPIEIIPLYSTKIANKWMQQFNQLLIWLDLRFKVISDMVRYEINPKTGEKVPNYEAGIDLLESFNNNHGFTTKILIFCGDAKKGMQNIQKRKIKDKIWSVTNAEKILLQYCDFNRVSNLSLSEKSNKA